MLTNSHINYRSEAGEIGDASLGNMLFKIAGPIGIATMKGYAYGFPKWINQQYFINPLPYGEGIIRKRRVAPNYSGIDFGFCGFDYPDNIDLMGEFGTELYFKHCEGLIRYYFEMVDVCEPVKDTILVHYRDYPVPGWAKLTDYYKKALKKLPKKPVLVVTDNIDKAYAATGLNCDYTTNRPIVDFYLLAHADYLVIANSTFSWWGSWLSKAQTVAPKAWYADSIKDAITEHIYLPNWTTV